MLLLMMSGCCGDEVLFVVVVVAVRLIVDNSSGMVVVELISDTILLTVEDVGDGAGCCCGIGIIVVLPSPCCVCGSARSEADDNGCCGKMLSSCVCVGEVAVVSSHAAGSCGGCNASSVVDNNG